MSKVAVIGGGASGIVAAIFAAKKNDVTIFCEQSLGKKLLVTGNGRCNLTNTKNFEVAYNQDVTSYLEQFNYFGFDLRVVDLQKLISTTRNIYKRRIHTDVTSQYVF